MDPFRLDLVPSNCHFLRCYQSHLPPKFVLKHIQGMEKWLHLADHFLYQWVHNLLSQMLM